MVARVRVQSAYLYVELPLDIGAPALVGAAFGLCELASSSAWVSDCESNEARRNLALAGATSGPVCVRVCHWGQLDSWRLVGAPRAENRAPRCAANQAPAPQEALAAASMAAASRRQLLVPSRSFEEGGRAY